MAAGVCAHSTLVKAGERQTARREQDQGGEGGSAGGVSCEKALKRAVGGAVLWFPARDALAPTGRQGRKPSAICKPPRHALEACLTASRPHKPAHAAHAATRTAMDKFDVSNFDLNAILRGAQLTLVGGLSLVSDTMSRPPG